MSEDTVDCTFRVAGAGSRRSSRHCGTEAVSCDSEWGHIFLGLKQDDVNLRGEEAAENHWATQADGDAHGGGLHLRGDRDGVGDDEWISVHLEFCSLLSSKALMTFVHGPAALCTVLTYTHTHTHTHTHTQTQTQTHTCNFTTAFDPIKSLNFIPFLLW